MTSPPDDIPPPPSVDQRAALRLEEYIALRATIRERGSKRIAVVIGALASWAGLTIAAEIWLATPVSTLIPLLLLAAGFEAVFALHVGVERIGRYIQVEYEDLAGGPAWEHTAMRFGAGQTPGAGRVDPLFSSLFIFGTILNIIPVFLLTVGVEGSLLELSVFGLIHLALIIRIVRARMYAARQRELDLTALRRST